MPLALPALLSGCSLALADLKAGPSFNSCARDSECGDGVCASDGSQQLCVARKADLGNLYLEVAVPADASFAAGSDTVAQASALGLSLQGQDDAGFVRSLPLSVSDLVSVHARLAVAPMPPPECAAFAVGGAIKAELELYPVGQPVGIALTAYSQPPAEGQAEPRARVPAGYYDVYLKPLVDAGSTCIIPPALSKNALIVRDTDVTIEGPAPAELTGHLDVPFPTANGQPVDCSKDAASCWTAQLVDNERGRIIGSQASMQPEGQSGTRFTQLFWRGASDPKNAVDPVLVLGPPTALAERGMPSLLWKLAAIDPGGTLDVSLHVALFADATSKYIPVEANVVSAGASGAPVAATVIVRSRQLLGGQFGDNAILQATAKTDADGRFSVGLLPGQYDFIAIPGDGSGYAITVQSWSFASDDLGKGRSLVMNDVSHLTGSASTPAGGSADGLPVLASPSSAADQSLLEATFGSAPSQAARPRNASTTTDSFGAFDLSVDPGAIDLSLRPDASTNLPWLVRRDLAVSPSPQPLTVQGLSFDNPAVLVGSVNGAGGALANVTVRAWLAADLSADDKAAGKQPVAVPIGEAVSDGAGNYRLLLPAAAQ